MPRPKFVRTSTQYLLNQTLPITGYPFTIACWVKPVAVSVTMTAVSLTQAIAGGDFYALGITSGAKPFLEAASTGANDATHQTSAVANVWGHLATVCTSSTLRDVYWNGVKNTTSATVAKTPVIAAMSIGAIYRSGGNTASPFDGAIIEVAVWRQALTSGQIAALANGHNNVLSIAPDSLASYVPIVQAAGATETDLVRSVLFLPQTVMTANENTIPDKLAPAPVMLGARL